MPDWFAALGTISAVGIALSFGLRDHARLERERAEAKEDRELFRKERAAEAGVMKRRLARKVTLVAQTVRTYNSSWRKDKYEDSVVWKVHNGGDEPISQVFAIQKLLPEVAKDDPVMQICAKWDAIEAGGSREHTTRLKRSFDDFQYQRELQFTDGAGRRWQRKTQGALFSVDPNNPDPNDPVEDDGVIFRL